MYVIVVVRGFSLTLIGVVESLINGLGYVRTIVTGGVSLLRACGEVSSVEEVTTVNMVYMMNNSNNPLGYGFADFIQLLGLCCSC